MRWSPVEQRARAHGWANELFLFQETGTVDGFSILVQYMGTVYGYSIWVQYMGTMYGSYSIYGAVCGYRIYGTVHTAQYKSIIIWWVAPQFE